MGPVCFLPITIVVLEIGSRLTTYFVKNRVLVIGPRKFSSKHDRAPQNWFAIDFVFCDKQSFSHWPLLIFVGNTIAPFQIGSLMTTYFVFFLILRRIAFAIDIVFCDKQSFSHWAPLVFIQTRARPSK